jgi:hypothetical protein
MAAVGYVGRYRRRDDMPLRGSYRRARHPKVAVALTTAGIMATVGVALGVRAPGSTEAPARAASASLATKATPATSITRKRGDVTLGKLALHFDSTQATTAAIAGDENDKRVSWTVQISNDTGTSVSIGDLTTILWTTDGSGHVAVTRQRVAPGSHRAVVISFELPEALEPSSITFSSGSTQATVKVKAV